MHGMHIGYPITPSEGNGAIVQVAAFQEVMQGGDIVLASHTGSGKTLAYLLPLVRLVPHEH